MHSRAEGERSGAAFVAPPMGEQVFPCNGRSSLSHRSDVRADEGDPTGPPDHSAVCDDADAAAREADHVDLLVLRPTSSTSAMPKAKCIAGRRERLAAAHGPMTTSTATRPSVAV